MITPETNDERKILYEAAERTGWDKQSMLAVALDYIENQKSPDAFRDHVEQRAQSELNAGVRPET